MSTNPNITASFKLLDPKQRIHKDIPTIYCINLEKYKDRRKRMEKRFNFFNLLPNVKFIKGVDKNTPLVDYYNQDLISDRESDDVWRGEMGCYASHLKAIRTFLEDGGEECLICEDDIILRNNFPDEYRKVRANYPDETFAVSYSYMMEQWEGFHWAGKDPSVQNIMTNNPKWIWGLQLYWINVKFAMMCLEGLDRPYKLVKPIKDENFFLHVHCSDSIMRIKGSHIAYPVLAIEEGLDSARREIDMPYHWRHFERWGYENFSDCECGQHVAPYAKTKPVEEQKEIEFTEHVQVKKLDITSIKQKELSSCVQADDTFSIINSDSDNDDLVKGEAESLSGSDDDC